MNILVFSWRDLKHPLSGGAEQVMHEHMKGWVAAGHNVTLFSSRSENAAVEEAIDGIHIVRQGYQYWGVQIAGFFYGGKLGKISRRERFDDFSFASLIVIRRHNSLHHNISAHRQYIIKLG